MYAAVVACAFVDETPRENRQMLDDIQEEMWVVSCATGSKCTSIRSRVSSFPPPNTIGNDSNHRKSRAPHKRTNSDTQFSADFTDAFICSCYNGMVLKDSHAETLARRGLMACLWDEVEFSLSLLQSKMATNQDGMDKEINFHGRNLLEVIESIPSRDNDVSTMSFRLKSCITLHLYVSDSPCGDAAIYEVRNRYNHQKERDEAIEEANHVDDTELNFTGAKIILCGKQTNNKTLPRSSSTVPNASIDTTDKISSYCLGRENVQTFGALRIKSSRSNIPPDKRTTSMSCSDKILRWGVFGLQGSLLSVFIPDPICFSSICVSKDARSVNDGVYGGQLVALERALPGRIRNAINSIQYARNTNPIKPPAVAVVDLTFESSKSAAEHRYLEAQINSKKRKIQEPLPVLRKAPKVNSTTAHNLQDESLLTNNRPSNEEIALQHDQSVTREVACGMSINWHQSFQANDLTKTERKKWAEITIGATGLKRGKKPKTPIDVLGLASRLCRMSFLEKCLRCTKFRDGTGQSDDKLIPHSEERCSYQQYKQKCTCYKSAEYFNGPLLGYLRSGHTDDFEMTKQGDIDRYL